MLRAKIKRKADMTEQMEFGGAWTQKKLDALSKYLRAYTTIFKRNPRAQYFTTSYVDAFAGTGSLSVPEVEPLFEYFPDLAESVEEYRKGSARRALEVTPPSTATFSLKRTRKSAKS